MNKTKLAVLSQYRFLIMGLATFLIMFFHLWINIFSNVAILSKVEVFIKSIAYYGVDIFFMMSAISLYHSLSSDDDILHFYKKRFSRLILPWLVCGILTGLDSKWSLLTFVKNITGYSFFFKSIYTFKWYIIAISIVYLFFPFCFHLFNKSKDKKRFTLIVVLVWIVIFTLLKDVIRSDFYGFIYRIPIFLVGVYFEYLIINEDKEISNIVLWLLFVIGILIAYYCKDNDLKLLLSNSLLAFSSCMLIASFFYKYKKQAKLLNQLGKCSLETYLFQELIGIKVMKLLLPIKFKLLINIVVLTIVSIICFYLHIFFERIRLKRI